MSKHREYDPDFGPIPGTDDAPVRVARLLGAVVVVLVLAALVLPAFTRPRGDGRSRCTNNLRQIGLALSMYGEQYGALPPACTVDRAGRPLHSWRTLLLPYLNEQDLYASIDLSKPWDDPVNAKLAASTLYLYTCPTSREKPGTTTYLATTAPDGCLIPGKPRRLAEITDSHDETQLVIEAGEEHAVPWMAPIDADLPLVLSLSPGSRFHHDVSVGACTVDGRVHFFRPTLPGDVRRALYTISGREAIPKDEDRWW
ncbi:hypothetical protein OJF2_01470 [Aquisphaera giovannonii]|uniref:DUF1559 domain-containing protein n=1 Tax=Aquisphaera giovannonii TaxID=406548 RepID=A0A5B9VTR3_9BACT|nr:DUF1559 domain-containing protein [Aquisphaera giovannonii]QEH31682.1 hypothetical protein OJF2_01470 [Aquisphaera giovannonii]